MLTEIHFILTFTCNFECDHCFLYCSPNSQGTFTIKQVTQILDDAKKIDGLEWIFFEGGEPWLFYPLLNESVRRASRKGFKVGIVTNAYGAISEEDAELWLKPLAESGLTFLNTSNDVYHYGDESDNPASIADRVAKKLQIDTSPISIEPPKAIQQSIDQSDKGRPVVGGGAKFRGRAVEKLAHDLPLRPWSELRECPYEDLASPARVHVDPFGNVHVCQGISIGNMWQTPLSEIISTYRPQAHPICGPLLRGGPAELLSLSGQDPEEGYIDECHLCYLLRSSMIDQHPDFLTPKQVYGIE